MHAVRKRAPVIEQRTADLKIACIQPEDGSAVSGEKFVGTPIRQFDMNHDQSGATRQISREGAKFIANKSPNKTNMKMKNTHTRKLLLGTIMAIAMPFALPTAVRAADHGDGPSASLDRACDIGDLYFFKDPTDPTKVVLIGTVQGFIVPSEASNFGIFDQNVRYRFGIENTGDPRIDKTIDVTFSPRVATAAGPQPQTATIQISGINRVLTAPTTNPTLANTANAQVVTPLSTLGIDFFAGEVDDPFFFDIVGFNQFVASVVGGAPDPTKLNRGRDSFAGYNTLAIALKVPIALLRAAGSSSTKLGATFETQRHLMETPTLAGVTIGSGGFRTIDRVGIPAVNVALVPFNKKNTYNASTPLQDALSLFAPDIVATLTALGASQGAITTLAGVAVANGDILRLETATASGFPNGRRLQDDVIDTILGIIAGGTLGDNVSSNGETFDHGRQSSRLSA